MYKALLKILLCVTIGTISWKNCEAKRLNVVTTLPSLASITESIGGDYITVYSITRGAQDAHYIEAKPSYMVKLHRADLLIYSGLELEIGWLPLLIKGARNNEVSVGSRGNLNASAILPLDAILEKPRGEVDRTMGDVHPLGNPHYLLNPYNGIRVAELVCDRLIELDQQHERYFRENLETFRTSMQNKITELEEKTASLSGKNAVCYHVHWSYLLEWLGINSVGYIELRPGIPPTPRHKQDIIQLMQDKQIEVVIISSWKEPTKAQEVANAANARLVVLPGEVNAMEGADDYISWFDYLVTHLVDAFSESVQDSGKDKQVRERQRRRRGID
jgi:zinc/manganese transport system substrate-binding protein